jgi:hypothetical protein
MRIGPPWTGHTSVVWSVAFRPDGRVLATASADGPPGWGMCAIWAGRRVLGAADPVLDLGVRAVAGFEMGELADPGVVARA